MRIRVAIIEQDTGYLEKITNVFNTRYTEQVEIHAFTVMNRAIEFLQSKISLYAAAIRMTGGNYVYKRYFHRSRYR